MGLSLSPPRRSLSRSHRRTPPSFVATQSRLMPYLLSALGDDIPDVYETGLAAIESLGIQYEKEHHDEVRGVVREAIGVHSFHQHHCALSSSFTGD